MSSARNAYSAQCVPGSSGVSSVSPIVLFVLISSGGHHCCHCLRSHQTRTQSVVGGGVKLGCRPMNSCSGNTTSKLCAELPWLGTSTATMCVCAVILMDEHEAKEYGPHQCEAVQAVYHTQGIGALSAVQHIGIGQGECEVADLEE